MTHLATDTLTVVSDRELITRAGIWEEHGFHVHDALLRWCAVHGMDAHDMPADNRIVRDPVQCRVEYDVIVRDQDGRRLRDEDGFVVRRAHVQGETPPMPFPDFLLRPIPDATSEGTA